MESDLRSYYKIRVSKLFLVYFIFLLLPPVDLDDAAFSLFAILLSLALLSIRLVFLASLLAFGVVNSYPVLCLFFVLFPMTLMTTTSSPMSLSRFSLSWLLLSFSWLSFPTPTTLTADLVPAAALPPLPLIIGELVASLFWGRSVLQIFDVLPLPALLLALLAYSSSLYDVVATVTSSRTFPLPMTTPTPPFFKSRTYSLKTPCPHQPFSPTSISPTSFSPRPSTMPNTPTPFPSS